MIKYAVSASWSEPRNWSGVLQISRRKAFRWACAVQTAPVIVAEIMEEMNAIRNILSLSQWGSLVEWSFCTDFRIFKYEDN